jgi:glycosyltransferase involved in cell wall biosynthesis
VTAASVSIFWLWSERGSPADRFGAFASAISHDCEVFLIGPPGAESALAALPHRFVRQIVLTLEGDRGGDGRSLAKSVNHAVPLSSSSFVVIVPSAAEPTGGWLEAMLDGVESTPSVVAVTPTLVASDGSLSAAGCVLWRDGTYESLGRGESPALLEHTFRRDVPAALPTYLLIRKSALQACDGFDEDYATTEYATADVCLRLRSAGGRVVYQPRATVRLTQSVSDAPARGETLTGDRDHLATRWSQMLERFPPRSAAPTTRLRLAARDALCTERMLIVDDRVPGADRGSGDPRMLRLVHEIAMLWPSVRLTFVALRAIEPERYAPPLLNAGIEVLYGCPDWAAWFAERRFHYGAVMISRPQPIDPLIRRTQPQAFRIYDAEAFVFRRLERMLPFIADRVKAREVASQLRGVRDAESEYLASSDLILCVSHEERRAARAIAERVPAVVVPHLVDALDAPPGFRDRGGLLYFGGFMAGAGSPNEDALLYLVSDVLPLLHAEEPDLVLYVVGADPTPSVRALESDRIRVIGYVPDSAVWLSRVRVHLAPMRFGSGVKLKLIDTMAAGLPFVTTAIGAEGLRLGALRRTLVAETPADLAALTLGLYRDEDRWTETQQALSRLARRYFCRDRFRLSLISAMTHVGLAPATLANEAAARPPA